MKIAKTLCALLLLIVFASMARTFWSWNESRGIHDDICYLRQAHLFQTLGLKGINTDIALDTDDYLKTKLRQIAFPYPDNPALAPCHHLMPATGRIVMQYPPGTGFILAAFPAGFQIVPLHLVVTGLLCLVALATIWFAATPISLAVATTFGAVSMYLMNNPVKSSYSLPPTMVVCVVAGCLTVLLLRATSPRLRLALAAGLGLLFGLGVNMRLGNLFLAAGYFGYFALQFARWRRPREFAEGALFTAMLGIGLVPTLIANAINAGSPFTTTYASYDASPPDFSIAQLSAHLLQYLQGTQGFLLCVAVLAVVAMTLFGKPPLRWIGLFVGCNLLLNLSYFLSHTIYTPYYAFPAVMLSLWTLLFAWLSHDRVGASNRVGVPGPA